jgi:hypothetical protein
MWRGQDSLVKFARSAPALTDAGASARLEVEDIQKPRAPLSATPSLMIEVIIVVVMAIRPTRPMSVGVGRFIADKSDEFFELTFVEPDAARCRTDIQLDAVAAYLSHR